MKVIIIGLKCDFSFSSRAYIWKYTVCIREKEIYLISLSQQTGLASNNSYKQFMILEIWTQLKNTWWFFASCQKNSNTFCILEKKVKHFLHFVGKNETLFASCQKIETLFSFCRIKWNTFCILSKKWKQFPHVVEKTESIFASCQKIETPFASCQKKLKLFLRFVEKIETLFTACQNKSLQFFLPS